MGLVPRRRAHLVFALLLAGFMTLVVSGVTTALNVGFPPDLAMRWLRAWLPSWGIAYPVLLVARPVVQRVVDRLTG